MEIPLNIESDKYERLNPRRHQALRTSDRRHPANAQMRAARDHPHTENV